MIPVFALVVLPFCNIVICAQKPLPQGYPKEPKTIGDHIKKVRLEKKLSRAKVAEFWGVSMDTVKCWETNRTSPSVTLIPKVIEFLGYAPFGDLSGMSDGEKIRTCRLLSGLTLEATAKRLGVCVTTLSSWENDRGIRKICYGKTIKSFLALSSSAGMA